MKMIEESFVSPPEGSVPTTSLPLTLHDIITFSRSPVQWLTFYEFPHTTQYFVETVVPSLKNSLSLTLQPFFPLVGNFMCPPPPTMPYIHYTGNDSIPFTVVVADSISNLDHLIMHNKPRNLNDLLSLVPKLPPTHMEGDIQVFPLMALQVTIFPNLAFSIGITFNHIVADGIAFIHFIKTWSSICKNGKEYLLCLKNENSLPFHDRSMFNIPNSKLQESILLKDFWDWASIQKEEDEDPSHDNKVDHIAQFTFVLGRAQIENLKRWFKNQSHNDLESLHLSTFVVTCALTWVCYVKSEMSGANNNFSDDGDQQFNFLFPADYRTLENSVPNNYFGNCMAVCFVSMKKRELLGANGIVAATRAIGKKVREVKSYKDYLEVDKNYQDGKEVFLNHTLCVGGSPKYGFYEIDFGWGRPKTIEILLSPNAISLMDTNYDKNGIKVGLAISRAKLEHFKAILEENLRMISSETTEETHTTEQQKELARRPKL